MFPSFPLSLSFSLSTLLPSSLPPSFFFFPSFLFYPFLSPSSSNCYLFLLSFLSLSFLSSLPFLPSFLSPPHSFPRRHKCSYWADIITRPRSQIHCLWRWSHSYTHCGKLTDGPSVSVFTCSVGLISGIISVFPSIGIISCFFTGQGWSTNVSHALSSSLLTLYAPLWVAVVHTWDWGGGGAH